MNLMIFNTRNVHDSASNIMELADISTTNATIGTTIDKSTVAPVGD
jgi:hypothetical protein